MQSTNRRGATAVEFAFAVVIVFMFVFGVIEFGRVQMVQHTIDNASYEAARHVVVPGSTAAEAIEAAQAILTAGAVADATITVSPNPLDDNATSVRVHVSAPLNSNAWIVPRFTANRVVESETELVTERAPGVMVGTTPTRPEPPASETPNQGGGSAEPAPDVSGGNDNNDNSNSGSSAPKPPPPPFRV